MAIMIVLVDVETKSAGEKGNRQEFSKLHSTTIQKAESPVQSGPQFVKLKLKIIFFLNIAILM